MNFGGVSKGLEQFFLPGRVPFTFLKVLGLGLGGYGVCQGVWNEFWGCV